jgi:hypothetical protein
MEAFTALTGDLIESRHIPDRPHVQEQLSSLLGRLNEKFSAALAVPFAITLGDEFQGLLIDAPAALPLINTIERTLFPVRITFGLGVGGVATRLASRTTEMDGECFHRSRQALEEAKAAGRRLLFATGDDRLDRALNTIELLAEAIRGGWSQDHLRWAQRYEELGKVESVAHAEGVTKQAVYQAFKRMNLEQVRDAEAALKALLTDPSRSGTEARPPGSG